MILNIIVFIVVILITVGEFNDNLPNDKCREGKNKKMCSDCIHTFCKYRYFDE